MVTKKRLPTMGSPQRKENEEKFSNEEKKFLFSLTKKSFFSNLLFLNSNQPN